MFLALVGSHPLTKERILKTIAETKPAASTHSGTSQEAAKLDIDLTSKPTLVTAVDFVKPLSPSPSASPSLADRSTSFVGPLANAPASEGGMVYRIEPTLIRLMPMPNRDACAFESDEFEELRIAVLSNGGNTVPIGVVEFEEIDAQGFKYELVYGERRMEACKLAKVPVLAYVKKAAELTPSQRTFETVRENQARQNLSPFEFGRQLKYVLDSGHARGVRMLGREIGRHHKDVSAAIKLACLPGEVISAFASTMEIQFRFEAPLAQALADNSEAVLRVARDIGSQPKRPPAREVFQRLIEAGNETLKAVESQGGGPSATPDATTDKGVLYANGKEVGRVVLDRKNRAKITLLPELTDKQQAALHKHIAAFVKRHFTEVAAPAQTEGAVPPPTTAEERAPATAATGAEK